MKSVLRTCLGICALLVLVTVAYAQDDRIGSKDHPLLSRMNDFYITHYKELDYDSHEFYDEKGHRITGKSKYSGC